MAAVDVYLRYYIFSYVDLEQKHKVFTRDMKISGGADGTIFATFSYHHRQKCSVCCNDSNRSQCKPYGSLENDKIWIKSGFL